MAIAMIVAGGIVLNYQRGGPRKFEFLLILSGVALVDCGIAIVRDLLSGSTQILWMLRGATQVAQAML